MWLRSQLAETAESGVALTATNLKTHELLLLQGHFARGARSASVAPQRLAKASAARAGSASSVATRRDPLERNTRPAAAVARPAAFNVCRDFNLRGCTRRAGTCRFSHVCLSCFSAAHIESSCPNKLPPSGAAAPAAAGPAAQ